MPNQNQPDREPARMGTCPDEDAFEIERIEVGFAIPVEITQDQVRRLIDLITEITKAPYNQLEGHIHWLFGQGSKPRWSLADQRAWGLPGEPDAPESGEPTFDHSVLYFETSCREK